MSMTLSSSCVIISIPSSYSARGSFQTSGADAYTPLGIRADLAAIYPSRVRLAVHGNVGAGNGNHILI